MQKYELTWTTETIKQCLRSQHGEEPRGSFLHTRRPVFAKNSVQRMRYIFVVLKLMFRTTQRATPLGRWLSVRNSHSDRQSHRIVDMVSQDHR